MLTKNVFPETLLGFAVFSLLALGCTPIFGQFVYSTSANDFGTLNFSACTNSSNGYVWITYANWLSPIYDGTTTCYNGEIANCYIANITAAVRQQCNNWFGPTGPCYVPVTIDSLGEDPCYFQVKTATAFYACQRAPNTPL